MPVSEAAVKDLQGKCRLPRDKCRAMLEKKRGDVDAALAALIDAGEVSVTHLDPESVSDELFARAELRRLTALAAKFAQEHPSDKETLAMMKGEIAEWKQDMATLGDMMRSAQRDAGQRKTGTRAAKNKRTAKGRPSVLKASPFPQLKAEDDQWIGRDSLATWKGFKGGTTITLRVQRPDGDDDDDDPRPPTREQAAAYDYLRANEQQVTDAVLDAVLKQYNALRRRGSLDEDVGELKAAADLKRHLGPSVLHVLDYAKGGHAYVGLDLHCSWDEEHGVGALLHKSRVVVVGQADTSFDPHVAKKDGGKRIAAR